MGRILAIDLGMKRSGLAVTDESRISVNPLAGMQTGELSGFLESYLHREHVDRVVFGMPEKPSPEFSKLLRRFMEGVKAMAPKVIVELHEEDYSSEDAMQLMIEMGIRQKERQKKETLDMYSAVVILKDYMGFD